MRYAILVISLGLFITTPVLALTYLGPTTTAMDEGQWSFGACYTESEQDLQFRDDAGEDLFGSGFEDARERIILGTAAVGLATDRAELFGRFGAGELHQHEFETDEDEFVGGLGMRITTNLGDQLSWGIVGQFTWMKPEGRAVVLGEAVEYELEFFDFQVALGPCWRSDGLILYGGPMLQFVDAELETDLFGDFDIEQESWFGGYLGGGIELAEHLSIMGEGQVTPDASAWAGSLMWRF
jgi:hypothetical protein